MRSGLPGGPVVEHIRNAPSPLMGIGAVLIIVGMFVMMVGPLGETTRNPVLTYIGIGGAIAMFIGLAFIGIGYVLLERRWKREERQ